MVAFRKLFPVLAVFALLLGALTAQGQPLQCNVTAGVPPVVRAEGLTELLGDIIISCTGGNNVAPFLANFQIFLNTNVTSRLVTSAFSEATLLIDDPGSTANPVLCPSTDSNLNGAGVAPGLASPSGCVPGATTAGITQVTPGNWVQTGTYNAFRGTQSLTSPQTSLVWANIPVVPPGTTAAGVPAGLQRTFRITNLRGNASQVGPGAFGPGQIVAYISVSGSASLALNNPQQIIGYVQPGLVFDVRTPTDSDSASIDISQCVAPASANSDLFADPTADKTITAQGSFRYREGFQNAFKPRILTGQVGKGPGNVFNTESGWVPNISSLGTSVGLADTGTRLAVRFSNVPVNMRIFVSTTNTLATGNAPRAVLVTTDLNGAGGTVATDSTGTVNTSLPFGTGGGYLGPKLSDGTNTYRAAEVPLVNGSGLAVWEIVAPEATGMANGAGNTNANLAGLNETLLFLYGTGYTYKAGTTQVGLGTGTVIGNFAPFYTSGTGNTMSQTLPIPRFVAGTTSSNFARVNACQTNLLFPYVTNWAGFDTGIAVANTSSDPFSSPENRTQEGKCRFNYYGTLANGNAPTTLREETDRNVKAGETITFVLSSGGGLSLRGNPGFQGYIIAQCDFRFAHGFAFITDGPIGQARVAEGYLALVLDGGAGTGDVGTVRLRGQSQGEKAAH